MSSPEDPRGHSASDAAPTEDGDVFALDNIRVELPYAGAGSRVLAGLLDYLIFYSLALALVTATITLLFVLGGSEQLRGAGGWVVALALLIFFLLESFYFAVQEILLDGQTLGKRALGLRVLAVRGHAAGSVALLLRNLPRSLDILLGAWFLVFERRSRRLGDLLAGTVVVHETAGVGAATVRRVPRGWGPERVRVAEELLDRVYSLDDQRARRLCTLLLDQIERDDPDFLIDVPRDLEPTFRLSAGLGAVGSGRVAESQGPA